MTQAEWTELPWEGPVSPLPAQLPLKLSVHVP